MFGNMFNDPFFNMHQQHMSEMNRMFANPFGGVDPFQHSIMAAPSAGLHPQPQQQQHQQQLTPFVNPMFGGLAGGIFGDMNRMMSDMNRQFANIEQGQGAVQNGHGMSHHSVMTYSSSGGGPPKVYEATSSTRYGPGQVKETRRTERDSESGLEKMALGRHIGEKGHVMEKSRNRQTGDQEENQEYLNLDEDELPHFDQQWTQQRPQQHFSSQAARHRGLGQRSHRAPHDPLAITDSAHGQRHSQHHHRAGRHQRYPPDNH